MGMSLDLTMLWVISGPQSPMPSSYSAWRIASVLSTVDHQWRTKSKRYFSWKWNSWDHSMHPTYRGENKISVAPSTLRDFAQMPISVDTRPQQQEFQVPISVDRRPQALSCLGCSTGIQFQNPGGPLPIGLVSLPLPMLWACGHTARRLNVPTP